VEAVVQVRLELQLRVAVFPVMAERAQRLALQVLLLLTQVAAEAVGITTHQHLLVVQAVVAMVELLLFFQQTEPHLLVAEVVVVDTAAPLQLALAQTAALVS